MPIEAKAGTTTGISAADRARTVLAAIDPKTRPADLARPGHMFPLRAMPGGVMQRAGQTEAAVDLARLAGLYPAGVICEVMDEDGTMMRAPGLQEFCRQHGLRMVTIKDLIQHRMRHERLVRKIADASLPTPPPQAPHPIRVTDPVSPPCRGAGALRARPAGPPSVTTPCTSATPTTS